MLFTSVDASDVLQNGIHKLLPRFV